MSRTYVIHFISGKIKEIDKDEYAILSQMLHESDRTEGFVTFEEKDETPIMTINIADISFID